MGTEIASTSERSLSGKRIVFVFNNLALGGAERQGLLLARHLAEVQKARVQVWGFDGPGRVAELCDAYGLPWRVVPFRWTVTRLQLLRELARFARQIRRARADILLPYILHPNLACCAVWKWTGAQLCLWQQRDGGLYRGHGRLERWAIRNSSVFVANATPGVDFLIQTLGVDPRRVRLIRNGVELAQPQESRAAWRSRLGLGEDSLMACMVASLHFFKDHETLLRAWRIVLDRWSARLPKPVLVLAGRMEDAAARAKAVAFDLELGRTVRFLGPVNDVSGLLAAADLGVFSSRSEGCPNGVLECMAAGLAVAATNIPGIRDGLGEEGVSMLAPPGDAGALADRIEHLLRDRDLRQREGARNRDRIEQVFSSRQMCEDMTKLIAGLLESDVP